MTVQQHLQKVIPRRRGRARIEIALARREFCFTGPDRSSLAVNASRVATRRLAVQELMQATRCSAAFARTSRRGSSE